MSHRHVRSVLAAVLAAGAVAVGLASTPSFWQVSSRADFLKGDVDNLAIDNDGRLALGPAMSLVYDSAAPFLWTLLPSADGAVYTGSGNEGRVFRIARDGKAALFYDAPELEIHALAEAPGGGLYVAASPDGRVYRVDAKGQATPFFAPEDKYIWSLAVDKAGNVFVGTGEKGVIYKVTPDGTGTPFYRTRSSNVVALAFDKDGNLLAGTESPGRVFRIDRQGRGFVLLESSFREIHSLTLDAGGSIYATAVSGQKGGDDRSQPTITTPEPAQPVPVPSVSTEITSISIIDVAAATSLDPKASSARVGSRPAKGAVFRIGPDGVWDTVWESPDDTPYAVAFDKEGGILIGTGNKGRIFRVAGDPPRVTLLGRAAAQQVTHFLSRPGGDTLYATANPGKVFALSATRADRGTYESEVKDASTIATWGTISWRASTPAGTAVEVRTRSGNSQTPDETWSAWSEAYNHADGQQITSPKARYLQWRATLTGKSATPVLTSVTAAYLQRNLRPKVTGITVYPPGVVFQRPFSTGEAEIAGFEDGWPDTRPSPSTLGTGTAGLTSPVAGPPLGRRIYQKGLQGFSWKAEDDNEDKLQYDVLYRREDETAWRTLRKGISDQLFVWDTTSVPNGTYVLRVMATDSPSNPPGAALTGEADSTAFDVDNTPPLIRILGTRREGERSVLQFEVQDDQSAVQRVDYSLDANRWRPIYPKDGICDSKAESFELPLDAAPSNVVIRAMDAMSNVATARGSSEAAATGKQGK